MLSTGRQTRQRFRPRGNAPIVLLSLSQALNVLYFPFVKRPLRSPPGAAEGCGTLAYAYFYLFEGLGKFSQVGKRMTVVVDEVDESGAQARRQGDAPEIDGLVFVEGASANVEPGDFIEVEIANSDEHDLYAPFVLAH